VSATRREGTAEALWRGIYGAGEVGGYLGLFCATRPIAGGGELLYPRSVFFEYPRRVPEAEQWCRERSAEDREVYFCAHLLTDRRRAKEHAAPVLALWADADGCPLPLGFPEPTAVVGTSPGRRHLFWRLSHPLPPREAEALNRRLSRAVGADRSGWDLTQLLRPPGTRNHKYTPASAVGLLGPTGDRYHPRELDLSLPSEERPVGAAPRSQRPTDPGSAPDLSRLSARVRALILGGNRGAGSPYPSRSEADFAVCLAMLAAGYGEADVWAAMTDPANGASEKYREKGRRGDAYLSLTIGKARALARNVS
jgi:hypothetical protein